MDAPQERPVERPPHDLGSHPLLANVPEHAGYKVLDPCVLTGVLGTGGMGVVFRGFHLRLGIEVAVKCMHERFGREPGFAERFRREANAAARIQHTNVVRVYDVAEKHGIHFLIMDLVEGEHARARVLRRGELEIEEALEIAWGAARGLAAAHKSGVLHRDIKPDNLLIAVDGEVKLVDLGLAKPVVTEGDPMTRTQAVFGTPNYMPPEQWSGAREVTAAGDVWALGASLYFFLTGKDALPSDPAGACSAILSGAFPDPRERRADVPAEVAALIARCTDRDPLKRPRDGVELAALLEPLAPRQSRLKREAGFGAEGDETSTLHSVPPSTVLAQIRRSSEPTQQSDPPPPASRSRRPLQIAAAAAVITGLGGLAAWQFSNGRAAAASPPVIELDDLGAEPLVTSDESYELRGRVRDARGDTAWITREDGNRVLAELDEEGRFSIELPLRPDARHDLRIATDGLEAPLDAVLVRDITAPGIRVLAPQPGTTTAARTLDVEVSLTEEHPAAVYAGEQPFSPQADGTWRIEGLELAEGDWHTAIRAVDAAGTEATLDLRLQVDWSAPESVSIDPAPGTPLRPGKASFELVANEPLEAVRLGSAPLGTSAERAWGELDVPTAGAAFSVELELVDALGNGRTLALEYPIEQPPPTPIVPPPVTRVDELEEPLHAEGPDGGRLELRGRASGPAAALRVALAPLDGPLDGADEIQVLEQLELLRAGAFEHTAALPDALPSGRYSLVIRDSADEPAYSQEILLDREAPTLLPGSTLGDIEAPLVHDGEWVELDLRLDEPARIHLIDADGALSEPWTELGTVHTNRRLPLDPKLANAKRPVELALAIIDARGNRLDVTATAVSRSVQVLMEGRFPPPVEFDVDAGTFTLWMPDGSQRVWTLPDGARIVRKPRLDDRGNPVFQVASGDDRAEMMLVPGGALLGPPDLTPYLIDRYEVTAERFARYRAGATAPRADVSQAGVEGFEADRFAAFAGKALPTVPEWRAAAAWDGDGWQTYSWGPELEPVPLRLDFSDLLLARDLEQDTSPFGVCGMGVGLSEWCQGPNPGTTLQPVMGGSSFGSFLSEGAMEQSFRIDSPPWNLRFQGALPSELSSVGLRCILRLVPQDG